MMHSESNSGKRWAVVGGGMLGMTAALRLAQAGQQVTIYEAANGFGGLADAWKLGDVTWDRHYHVTLLSDSYTRGILRELGLDEQMQWVETKTGFFTDGRLHSMSSSLDFLMFPPLSLLSKFRLGLTIFAGSRIRNWKRLEHILVSDWLRSWSGKKTFEKIWLPLLRSKLGDNYKKTSAAFIWATIARLYAARRTGLKKEMFGYLPGGYGRTLEEFTAKLTDLDVELLPAHGVSKVAAVPSRAVEVTANDVTREFDRVILTVPSNFIPQVLPQLDEREAKLHSQIDYQGIICVSLLLDKPLDQYYVTNITDGNAPFTGVIEMSTLVDPKEFGGKSLVYLPFYLPQNAEQFGLTDDQIRELSLKGLEEMYPAFHRDHVIAFRASRVKRVMAIPTIGYSETLPPIKTSVPNVYAVNSAQIVNGTLNVNESIKLAETAVRDLLSQPIANTTERHHAETVC